VTTPAELSEALTAAREAAGRELKLAGVDADLVAVFAVALGEEEGSGVWRYCGADHPGAEAIAELNDGEHITATFVEGLARTIGAMRGGRVVVVGRPPPDGGGAS
jgi:hypothetical protein